MVAKKSAAKPTPKPPAKTRKVAARKSGLEGPGGPGNRPPPKDPYTEWQLNRYPQGDLYNRYRSNSTYSKGNWSTPSGAIIATSTTEDAPRKPVYSNRKKKQP